ncbi:MAG: PASTA domain-containing protein [Chitinispirillaceae bacterium]|nr:PASTA domain-containing protein [Chitinispirillaceae bacterium]
MLPGKKYYSFSIPAGLFWKLYLPVLVFGALLAAAGGVFFADIFVMPRIVGNERDVVEVPGVTGVPLEEAREKFFAAGLLTEVRSRDFDNAIPEDAVIAQMPEAGARVKKGRRISVVVSKGKEFAVIPDIINMTERQARMELKNRGFIIGEVREQFHGKQPPETVFEVFPKCGTTISRDMKVGFVISKGPKPTSAEMPNIVGENLAGARKILEETGLKAGKISYRNDRSLLPGTVISQSVSPGENVPFETPVDMAVSVIQ